MAGNADAQEAVLGAAVISLDEKITAEDSATTANPQAATLKCHPACELLPEMTEAEFRDLVEDIRTNGLRHPIIIDENGLILDGRHRYRALQELGIDHRNHTTPARCHTEAEKVALVMSENINRRHLTTQQRAAIAAELATMKHGGDRKSERIKASTDALTGGEGIKASTDALTDAQAAKVMGVSEPTVERAKRRMRTDPEAHAKAKAGKLPRAKPSKIERRLRQNLGERRAEQYIEAHPEIAASEAAKLWAGVCDFSQIRRAVKAYVEDIASFDEWLRRQPINLGDLPEDMRRDVKRWRRWLRDRAQWEAFLFGRIYDVVMMEEDEPETLAPPEPTEELATEQQGNGAAEPESVDPDAERRNEIRAWVKAQGGQVKAAQLLGYSSQGNVSQVIGKNAVKPIPAPFWEKYQAARVGGATA